jgi:hypothetical protein
MKLKKKIEDYHKNQKFSVIERAQSGEVLDNSTGYIVGYSKKFVIVQETDDFRLLGCKIFPVDQIETLRRNEFDEYYDKIMEWEGEKKNLKSPDGIDLSSWKSVFESLKDQGEHVIVECELDGNEQFVIGSITKVTGKNVFVRYFDAQGILEDKPTKFPYKSVTIVGFSDRYIDVFSKYLRNKKEKKEKKEKKGTKK